MDPLRIAGSSPNSLLGLGILNLNVRRSEDSDLSDSVTSSTGLVSLFDFNLEMLCICISAGTDEDEPGDASMESTAGMGSGDAIALEVLLVPLGLREVHGECLRRCSVICTSCEFKWPD